MLHHTRQSRFMRRWKYAAEKFYSMPITDQTRQINAEQRFGSTKDMKKSLVNVSRRKVKIFTSAISANCSKDGEIV